MKNKRNNDFHQFRVKILLRIIALLGIAAAIIYITFSFLPRGNFANLMMSLLQNIGGMNYDRALELYSRLFRSHMDTIILVSILFVFIGLLYILLHWFTRYFEESRKGMDAILQNTTGEISLSPELIA